VWNSATATISHPSIENVKKNIFSYKTKARSNILIKYYLTTSNSFALFNVLGSNN